MKRLARIAPCVFFLALLAGCASHTLSARQEYQGAKIARPGHILVYDFAAAGAAPGQESTGSQLGAKIAQVLVGEIRGMGLAAEPAVDPAAPRPGDLVIQGRIDSIDEGDAAKRVAVGFGAGASHLKTTVEASLMTDRGLQRLGGGSDDTGGSKSPGTAMALAGAVATGNPAGLIISTAMKAHGESSGSSTVEGRAEQTAKDIAKELKKKFKQQGWI